MTTTAMLPKQGRSVMLRAESFDPDQNTVDICWTTGATVQRYSYRDGAYLEALDLSAGAVRLGRLNAGAPFLNTHSSYDLSDVIGSVVPGTARIEKGQGLATIKLSGAAADADTVAKIKDGIIRNVSVGYLVHEVVKTEADDGTLPTWRVTDWEPIEISAVPIPADAGAQIRSGDATADLHPCTVRDAGGKAAVSASSAAPAADTVTAFRAAEKARVQAIRDTATKLGTPADVLAKHLDDGTSADEFRALAIDLKAARTESTLSTTPAETSAHHGADAMTDRANDTAAAGAAVETRAAPAVAPVVIDEAAIRASERARATDIRAAGRKLGLPTEFVDKHVDEGTSVDAFRNLAIDAAAERSNAGAGFGANPGASDRSHARTYAQPKVEVEKGVNAARIMVALAASRGSARDAADFISKRYGPEGEIAARALGTGVGSAGGFLVPVEMSSEIIEFLRPASVVMASGPRILPMPSGNMMVPRITGGSNANYVGENQPIPASQPSFGGAQLVAKKLAVEVPISNDMIRFASAATDAVVRDDMVRSIAVRADLAFIRGAGSQYSPRGLRSYAGATALAGGNLLTAGYKVGSDYASQGQTQSIAALVSVTTDLGRAELALMNANIPMAKPGWLMAPRTAQYLMNLRDGLGNQVYYAEMSQGRLRGKPYRTTTQIPTNLAAVAVDGATATLDGSEIYLADFAEVFIGEAYGLELDVFPGGTYVDSSGAVVSGISNDQTVMRAIVQHDMVMRQEAAVAVITGARWF